MILFALICGMEPVVTKEMPTMKECISQAMIMNQGSCEGMCFRTDGVSIVFTTGAEYVGIEYVYPNGNKVDGGRFMRQKFIKTKEVEG